MNCDIDKSVRLNQITVKFKSPIGDDTRKALQNAGFSWNVNFLAWTAPFTPERNKTINLLCNGLDAEITSDNMTKAEIAAEIQEYRTLLDQPDNIVPADEKKLAKDEIASLEALLAQLDDAPKPAPAEKESPKGRPKGSQNKSARKSPPPLEGPPVDKNGDTLSKGDAVRIEWGGNFYEGTVTAPMRYEGGSHSVKFLHNGKNRTMMLAPKYVEKQAKVVESITYTDRLRADQVDEALVAKHRDCDEAKTNLVVPTEVVHIALPSVADPAKGDMVEVHEDGTPKAVITAQGLQDNFTVVGEGDMKERPDGTVKFGAPSKKTQKPQKEKAPKPEEVLDKQEKPEEAAKPKPEDDTRKYRQVKSERPTGSCSTTREAAKTPALVAFLEGMVHDWHSEDTVKRIKRVLWRKKDNKLLIEVRDTLFGYSDYFTLCAETGKTKETDTPKKSEYSTIMGEEAMKDMYRNPHSSSCRRVAAALYGECYRNGGCSEERQKRLYAIFASKCIKRNLEVARQRIKWLHEKTKEKWQGYKGEKSYAQIFRETARANYKK